jgi:hypothetical protein
MKNGTCQAKGNHENPALIARQDGLLQRFVQDITVASGNNGGNLSVGRSLSSSVKTENDRNALASASPSHCWSPAP